MVSKKQVPNYIVSVLQNKCPRCREGKLFVSSSAYNFKNNTTMNNHCPVCGQETEIEVGFYYGTAYVSYGLTVAFSVATFVAWWVLIGVSINDNRLFWWLGLNSVTMLLMQPLFMRLSRSLWLSWFVKYDAAWHENKPEENERVVQEHMKNW